MQEALPEKQVKTFADVKGCPDAKGELEEVVAFLKHPDRFTRCTVQGSLGCSVNVLKSLRACLHHLQHSRADAISICSANLRSC